MDMLQYGARFFTEPWFGVFVSTALFLILIYRATNKRRMLEAQFPSLPGPKPLPFVGNLLDQIRYKGQIHLQFEEYVKKYGNFFAMFSSLNEFALFSVEGRPALIVSDPELIKQIMVKDFSNFQNRAKWGEVPSPFDAMLSVVGGERWREVRNFLSPTFSALKMKHMLPLMNESIDMLMGKFAEAAGSGKPFNMTRYLQRLTLDVIMSCAFGIKTNCQKNPDDPVVAIATAGMTLTALQKYVVPLLGLLPFSNVLLGSKWFSNIVHSNNGPLVKITQDMIEAKKQGKTSGRKDLLDLMLNSLNENDGKKKLSDLEIGANSINFLMAGYETSSTTLGLVCYHLAANQDVQDKAQEEVDRVYDIEDKTPSYDNLHELPYLDMVIYETLRLYPPGAVLNRAVSSDCVLKGIHVKKGTPVFVPVYSVHRNPKTWPQPEKFDPMRFSAEAKQSRDPYNFLPFGVGPHQCIGMRFAIMEMKLALCRILKKYRFEVSPETAIPPQMVFGFVLANPDGNMLRVVHRQ